MLRRAVVIAALVAATPLAGAGLGAVGQAEASVSVGVTLDALVQSSTAVCVVTPVEQRAVWENGRIVTYTRARVDEPVAGDLAAGAETWIASLGGVVGSVGQTVDGEARLRVGAQALVFLRPDGADASVRIVTARAQGFYPALVDAQGVRRFAPSNSIGAVLAPVGARAAEPLAGEVLRSRTAEDAMRDVRGAWGRLHAAK